MDRFGPTLSPDLKDNTNLGKTNLDTNLENVLTRSATIDKNFGLELKNNIYHVCDTRQNNPVSLGEILQRKNTTVVYFMRRLGCFLTRSISQEFNSCLLPKLDPNSQFIVIASENVGHEDFLNSNILSNLPITHFFYDPGFSSFSNLQFKRYSGLKMMKELFSPKTFKLTKNAISAGISADFSGDVYQNGGLLIFQNQLVKFIYKQTKVSEFIKCEDIMFEIDPLWNERRITKLDLSTSGETRRRIQSKN